MAETLSFLAQVCRRSVREGKDAAVGFYSSYDITLVSAFPSSARHTEAMPFRGATNAAANVTSDSCGFSGRLELQNTRTAKEARNG